MRTVLLAVAFIAAGGPSMAEIVTPNHLDCNFNDATQALVCPEIPMSNGRAAAEPAPVEVVPSGGAAKGSAEWNAHCAAKYKSFDAATGMYQSFGGKTRPCV